MHLSSLAASITKKCAYHVWRALAYVLPPAQLQVDVLPRFRSDAFLYLSLSHVGTIAIPRETLLDMATRLDTRSYLRLLTRNRHVAHRSAERVSLDRGDLTISLDYFIQPTPSSLHAPYFLHPNFYSNGAYRRMGRPFNRSARPIRLIFAGTFDRKSYTSCFSFPILNRADIIEYIIDAFRDDCHIITTRADSARLPKIDKPIVMVLTKQTEDTTEKHLLTSKQYMNALSASDFSLCPPGCQMPQSHNLIEAILQGSIPVTNYSSELHPPLRTGHNCIGFSTLNELDKSIRDVLTFTSESISIMRDSVFSYAQYWLTPEQLAKRINTYNRPLTLRLNGESISVQLLHKRIMY